MKKISSRLDVIKPSATLSVTQKAGELRAQGLNVIGFSAGEPDFATPDHIVESAIKSMKSGFTRYTPATGMADLKKAVAEQSKAVRGVDCAPNQVIVGVGAKHVLYNFFMAVLNEGDEVVIPAPYWVSYPDQVLLAGGKPVFAETKAEDNWVLTPAELERVATEKTKVVVLNSPSNPTGGLYSKEAMTAVVEKAIELDLFVISDEIYRDLVYDGNDFYSALSVQDNKLEKIFIVDGVSKTFAMTGWRIGWGIGDPEVIAAMGKIQGQSTSNPTSFAQAASVTAITEPMDFLPEWKKQYVARRDTIVDALNAMEGVTCLKPQGAFYVFPNVAPLIEKLGADKTDIDFATWLLEKAQIATVPGTPFGAPGYIRISYATSMENIQEGLKRMADAFKTL